MYKRHAYDSLMDKYGVKELLPCPSIKDPEKKCLKDHAIILDQGDDITANIPVPYVFTDKYEDSTIIWGDIPCLGLFPHLGLFNMFDGKWNSDYVEYMQYCRRAAEKSGGVVTSKAWEASVYQNRLDVFNHMQYSWEHDRNFFIRNAVEGEYNPKGYFNIRSGKHRIAYMLVKKSRYIPLRIKKADYELWREKDRADRIAEFLWKTNIETLPIVLMNPYFYDYTSNTSVFYEKVLTSLLTILCKDRIHNGTPLRFEGESILFCGTPMALYAQIFCALGFKVYIFEQNEMNRQLNEVVLSGTVFQLLEAMQGGPETYDAAIIEEPALISSIHARISAIICGEEKGERQRSICGIAGDKHLYAYFELDGAEIN